MFSHVFTVSLCLKINHNEITILTVMKCFSDFTIFTALQCYAVPCIVFTVFTGFTVFTVSTIVTVFSVSLSESTVDPVRRVFPLWSLESSREENSAGKHVKKRKIYGCTLLTSYSSLRNGSYSRAILKIGDACFQSTNFPCKVQHTNIKLQKIQMYTENNIWSLAWISWEND